MIYFSTFASDFKITHWNVREILREHMELMWFAQGKEKDQLLLRY